MGFLNDILEQPRNQMPYLLLVVGHPSEECRVPDIRRLPFEAYARFV
jgi:hypothetical protein